MILKQHFARLVGIHPEKNRTQAVHFKGEMNVVF